MLVTFSSDAYADITLFGDQAMQLIEMMGHSRVVPGAILAADVPAALATLQRAITNTADVTKDTDKNDDDDDETKEDQVPLSTRAFPLLQLLHAAASENADVLWHN